MNNNLTAKQYLSQIRTFDEFINQNIERLNKLKIQTTCTGAINYDKERVITSPAGDTLSKSVSRYVDLENKINAEIDRFVDVKEQIIRKIRGLDVLSYIKVLYKIYVQYKSLDEVSEEMNITYKYASDLHNEALAEFERVYENLQSLNIYE